MTIQKIDGKRFAQMVLEGANNLSKNAKMVDALNVFPVPDGDTGTNMNLTITSGAAEVRSSSSDKVGDVASLFARGLLMGARGNSGVILSQLFRGFSKSIEGKSEITSVELAAALENGVDSAYKAVMKPVEGTILTVAKDAARKAVKSSKKISDVVELMQVVVKEGKESLNRTPDLLPVLKEVGVVDSGGQGLLLIYEGFLAVLEGKETPDSSVDQEKMDELVRAEHHKSAQGHMKTEDIEFGYCTEFMVQFENEKLAKSPYDEEAFRNELDKHGDSLLVVSDEDLVKVHMHTEYPGNIMTYAQNYGSLIKIKIENMREQHSTILKEERPEPVKQEKPAERKKYAIITVSMGDGIATLFESLGANYVIPGGQTMNPSTEDIIKAIEEVYAENIIILPNNSNIVMTAQQAASVVDENVIVIPSKTVPQGISSLLGFNPSVDPEANEEAMKESLSSVKSGQVTFAVRDTKIDGIDITKDDFMGIADGKIIVSEKERLEVAKSLLSSMITEDDEIVTIIYGEDTDQEEAESIVAYIEEQFDEVEVELHEGKQPIYSYIMAVE
ncbi:DAK2 domain-containing protein [Alkalihalobacillus hwajinpoensis]|uniref:DAK2 domain-containing protein n=1 Tax=Guptibacillus hwajinpoensis TaxID=208199 RepID=UPI0018840C69|nr:DAK2 domain-containing protein [Pseudalkalibacillus hwajinpoensis]MBF0708407.1 DAK2 domain-containing protein [Pseudalkalibacillus hwajinpoensis]